MKTLRALSAACASTYLVALALAPECVFAQAPDSSTSSKPPLQSNVGGSGYPSLQGTVVNYEYQDFAAFNFGIFPDKARWHGVKGYYDGLTAENRPHISKVREEIYFISWPTPKGGGDNVVWNFADMEVNAHLGMVTGEVRLIAGPIHCRGSADQCTAPIPLIDPPPNAAAVRKANASRYGLIPIEQYAENHTLTSQDITARAELKDRAILFNTEEGVVRIEVQNEETRVRIEDGSIETHQTFATKITDDLYFISWAGSYGGNHLMFDTLNMKAYDHLLPNGKRQEQIYPISCFANAEEC